MPVFSFNFIFICILLNVFNSFSLGLQKITLVGNNYNIYFIN